MDNFSHDLKFAFSDFIKVLKRNKKILLLSCLLGAILCFSLSVTRPVHYLLQASFRDKGKTKANIHSSLTEMLISSSSPQDSEAISVMKSHFLLSQVIKDLNIQGKISKRVSKNPELDNVFDNLLAEWIYWSKPQIPVLKDPTHDLILSNIAYEGEVSHALTLHLIDATHFSIQSDQNTEVMLGTMGEPFQMEALRFTIDNPRGLTEAADYTIIIQPMANTVNALTADLVIKGDNDDKSLLRLNFKNRDRHFAKRFLNILMKRYQNHLEEDHELSSTVQVNYLEKRQKDAGDKLAILMDDYVKNVSDDMSKSGFTSLQKEMDFLASNLSSNQQKLTEIELEVRRLKNINCNECVHYDAYTVRGDPGIINHLLGEIRNLKQQSDSLELALQNRRGEISNPKELLEENFKNLECTNECVKEVENLIWALENKNTKPPQLTFLDKSGYMVSAWLSTYQSKEKAWNTAPQSSKADLYEDYKQFRQHFLSYLNTFDRLMKIQQFTMQQRMRTQKVSKEFEGITLDTSRNLYLTFVQELNELEAQEKQHRFVIEQLKNPEFELSSLTALLSDPISKERIAGASQIVIDLKDQNNRTQKELERLGEELNLQKVFLNAHILQMADLLELKADLIREKIIAVQNTTLELTHQKVSLVKKHLDDYLTSRIDNLSQEKKILDDHQIALHARMSSIPPKWASEQLLNQSLELQERFLENLATMVESKNITKNLEMVQSSPLDFAIAPLHPKPPRLVFFTLFGSILGFIGASGFLFTRTMLKGIPASHDNLRLAHLHVSGTISPFQGDEISATAPFLDTDLDTLRRLIARFEQNASPKKEAKLILIAPGNGPDFSNTLAKLLAKKGQTTLKLQLGFQKEAEAENLPGLLQYLEGKEDTPLIQELDGFDRISAGGISRYSEELLVSPRFSKLLEKLKSSYNWILGVTSSHIPSAEVENLAKLFDGTVIVVTTETLQNLITFNNTLDSEKRSALTFVMTKSS